MQETPRLTTGGIVHITYRGEDYEFFVPYPDDHIAQQLMKGSFYETEELEIIAQHVKPGSRVIEIGANIGNHTVYFERVLNCQSNIVFEINPVAIRALELNIRLNALQRVNRRFLGIAVSDREGSGTLHVPQCNLGGTSFVTGSGGSIPSQRGDLMLANEEADFIKIDVEGGEMQVLEGLANLIERSEPLIFVEIDKPNDDAFHRWAENHRYTILDRYRRYVGFNYMIRRQPA